MLSVKNLLTPKPGLVTTSSAEYPEIKLRPKEPVLCQAVCATSYIVATSISRLQHIRVHGGPWRIQAMRKSSEIKKQKHCKEFRTESEDSSEEQLVVK